MPKFIIQGEARLKGEIEIKGAKNAALKIIPASLLSRQKISIKNLPKIEDIDRCLELLANLGGNIERNGSNCEIETAEIKSGTLSPVFANKFRASVMFVGPILARTGEVRFPHPGGCVIGAGGRPIDLFLSGFKKLGAEITEEDGFHCLKAKKLIGAEYFFTTVSVTGTEAMIMTAVLAEGVTVLKNCAQEPEIKALADYLNECGAKIKGAGTSTVTIEGVKEIGAGEFSIIPDRIETGTFALMAASTKSELTITKCIPEHIEILLNIFDKQGVNYERGADWLKILSAKNFNACSIKTHEYPGFPTDLQAPYTVFATQATGSTLIHETIFDRRLMHVDMLTQMGADVIMCDPHRVVIHGPTQLYGRKLTSPDLRAGIAMIIAALIAKNQTEIDNIYQIDRGYENIEARLNAIGAEIQRAN